MKRLFITLITLSISSSESMFGQGTYFLENYEPSAGVNAPVFDATGVPLAGSNYLAELWGGPSLSLVTPATYLGSRVMQPFFTGDLAGYFDTRGVEVSGVYPGSPGWVEVRAWDARLGSTYEEVAARGIGGYGESASLFLFSGGAGVPPSVPVSLVGLQSFSLLPVVPEPTACVLLLVGAGLFAAARATRRHHPK